MPDAHWILTEHIGAEGFAAVRDDWRRLTSEMPDPAIWHSYEAYAAYIANLCPVPAAFRCLALSDGQRTRAILPLGERLDRGLYEGGRGVRMRVLGMPWRKENWALTDAVGPRGRRTPGAATGGDCTPAAATGQARDPCPGPLPRDIRPLGRPRLHVPLDVVRLRRRERVRRKHGHVASGVRDPALAQLAADAAEGGPALRRLQRHEIRARRGT